MSAPRSSPSHPTTTAARTPPRPAVARWVVSALAALVALYGLAYVVVGAPMYPPEFAASFRARPWGIYPHAFFAALALALGPLQFHPRLRRRRTLHRSLGKLYVAACVLAGITGLYMAAYSYGGWPTHLGFGALAVLLLGATCRAYVAARRRDIATHRAWMLRSYALIFAGVMLRLELPVLSVVLGDFLPAYRAVAWLCWVPNLLWAEWYLRHGDADVRARSHVSVPRRGSPEPPALLTH